MPPLGFLHGAIHAGGATRFRLWAPRAHTVELRLLHPRALTAAMQRRPGGYWEALLDGAPPGARYLFRLDGGPETPDPASRSQPGGVHAPSEVVDQAFPWRDGAWWGLPIEQSVFYELHIGTFTPEGTFDAAIAHLDDLRGLGVTYVELMPVAQFPGNRNWGYDGVYPFAVQNSYGGPAGLKRLVNECHQRGLGVFLDVVYNHLGPEGNYLARFGPYFTADYRTPWGDAINFDGPDSDGVRRFFIENALYWIREFHIDGLRLDAVHGIFDRSAYPFLEELGDAVREEAARLNRRLYLVPESDLNDPRLIRSKDLGGFGLDAQWADGFHHALRVLLTGERDGYYQDFGELGQLAKAFEAGYVFTGEYSRFRRRRHGAPTRDIPPHRFVVFSQNHDQVGNRMFGERLGRLVSFEDLKLAAAAVILSPHLPLLFMGEEYGETAPFLYFVSHSDPGLVEAVRRGRKEEFAAFAWQGEAPDPQAEETFLRSKLDHALRGEEEHRALHAYYRELLRLRRETPALARLSKDNMTVATDEKTQVLCVRRWRQQSQTILALCFSKDAIRCSLPAPAGDWTKLLDSSDAVWRGPGGGVPAYVRSHGELELALNPRSALLLECGGGEEPATAAGSPPAPDRT